jgi:hypothetical protein
LFGSGIEQRWGLEGMIDPGPQLAIDEQLLTQQGDQIGQAPPEAGAELEIFEQKQGDERGPYLNLQGAGADKGFNAQVLFEGLEKQLDLPAAFVDLGDGGGSEMTMIGEKDQGALVLLIPDLDAAREQVALLAGQLVEEGDQVALDGSALGDRAVFQHAVIGVVLYAGDEEDALPVEGGEPVVVVVAAVEDHDGSWLVALVVIWRNVSELFGVVGVILGR